MPAVTDMLGQFFSSGRKGAGAQHPPPATTLDSATEESHTRHLLYPDAGTLYHPEGQPYPLPSALLAPGSAHDGPHPEIDLEFPRDCRIIIAQDESGQLPKTVLFDSKPSPPRAETSPTLHTPRSKAFGNVGTATTAGPSFGGMHSRRSSLVTESSTPRSPTIGTFTRTRPRGGSISSMPNIDEHAQQQGHGLARAKESTDLVNICLDCMFGNTAMNYRGNSNKLHIVPLDARAPEQNPFPANIQDATNSLGRAEGLRRRSHLAKSYTPSNLPPDLPRAATTGFTDTTPKEPRRRTILITRLFSVAIPDENFNSSQNVTPTPQNSLGKTNGYPFPRTTPQGGAPRPASQRCKTPMYAITIILHLPVASTSSTMRPPSRPGTSRTPSHISASAPGGDSLGSSLDSDRRAGWAVIDSSFGVESFLSTSLNSDVDDRVDVIGQHWDVITRTLTSLQFAVQDRILAHFKLADTGSLPVLQHPRMHQSTRSASREGNYQQPPPRQYLRLQPNALALDVDVKKAVDLAGNRVVSGMRIPRVVTGQGRWGVWREEARWLGRWAGRREQNFFFFNLLTAFLGNHREWLNLVGPKSYRKKHREQQKSCAGENLALPTRTVIVSPGKMAARRLIFLLAAFLPSTSSIGYDGASPMRPSTSASLRGYSQSPPTNMPLSRKQSLRRQINRLPRAKPSLTNVHMPPPATNGGCLAALDTLNGRSDSGVAEFQDTPRHSRRSSAHSIRTSLVIPSMSDSVATSKSSTATVTTVAPQNSLPVAHFALPRTKSSGPSNEYRPENSDSLASANLMQSLQRTGTGHTSNHSTDSGNTSRWSGILSFWNGGRRDSTTEQSDFLQTTDDGLGTANNGPRATERSRSTLEQMVHDLSMDQVSFGDGDHFRRPNVSASSTAGTSPEIFPVSGPSGVIPSAALPIPERPKQFASPLKLSVNEKDGVIDVDLALPDFGSPLQSPLLGGFGSVPSQHGSSFGESSVFSIPFSEPDQPVNAAGWLKQFHPDFELQAIKPYAELERDIKRAMGAEPTPVTPAATMPTPETGPFERWVDVCSVLLADAGTFSIKRIRLRRLIRLVPTATYQQSTLTPGFPGVPRSQYGNPTASAVATPAATEVRLEERFIEESVMDFDPTLIEAVDRVLAQSGQGSRVTSASSSRSSSRRGRLDVRVGSDLNHHVEVAQTDCRGIIFDALESVVKDVTAEHRPKDLPKNNANGSQLSSHEILARAATDSSLKEGIRRWLTEADKKDSILHWVKPGDRTGEFKRGASVFRNFIQNKPDAEFPAEKDRYHLYVSYACPWAHRTLLVRKLKGLDNIISFTSVHWHMGAQGWRFVTADEKLPGENVTADPLHSDFTHIRKIYFEQNPDYEGRFTVPVLYDKKTNRIVSNESSEIIRMFYTEFDHLLDDEHKAVDLFPEHLRKEIEEMNEWVYNDVNNGVYKSGFATTEEAYTKAVKQLFTSLDRLESHLSTSTTPYLLSSPTVTEADVRLYTTIVRFDAVYVQHFKTNIRDIRSGYPHLHKWLRHLYWDYPAFKDTTEFEHIKYHYTKSHAQINPFAVTPVGPLPDILGKEEEVPAVMAALAALKK
ncbi:hypothetical protein P154DRAFT_583034 [Amniculicola lignicola CBS 123094]|uniref:GST C-terminal domain-containing protein n=1 Tax=Amniculicola lignicola CBS 123094 TaxID=1392246 RepID=A0A6A5VV01_9PLEO|nr:hypothetical protein P154DRAFT_583034 [Amniculicola lignicola CBS 123094]